MNLQSENQHADVCLERRAHPVQCSGTITLARVDATRAPATAIEFFQHKAACYSRFGSQAAANHGKPAEKNLHLIVARDGNGVQIGGIAIYVRDAQTPLPVEAIIGNVPGVADEIESWNGERGLAELSGFWVDETWRKSGLTRVVLLCALAASHHLGVSKVIGFSHNHVIDFYATVGYLAMTHTPTFDYPHPPYVSMLVWADALGFSTVPAAASAQLQSFVASLGAGSDVSWVP